MNAAQFSRARDRIEHEGRTRRGFEQKALRKLVREARAVTVIWGRHVRGWRLPDGVMVCRKRRYATSDQAVNDMLSIQAQNGKRGVPRRAYECEFCGGFHLTSKISIKEE